MRASQKEVNQRALSYMKSWDSTEKTEESYHAYIQAFQDGEDAVISKILAMEFNTPNDMDLGKKVRESINNLK